DREGPSAIIYDEEYTDLLAGAGGSAVRIVGWTDRDGTEGPPRPAGSSPPPRPSRSSSDDTPPSVDDLASRGATVSPPAPAKPGRTIILTSGTTGTPKGAPRHQETGVDPVIAMLDRIPYRAGETAVVAAPLFHSWGFANLSLGLLLGSTFVLRRR